jgi:hypothetical protein
MPFGRGKKSGDLREFDRAVPFAPEGQDEHKEADVHIRRKRRIAGVLSELGKEGEGYDGHSR